MRYPTVPAWGCLRPFISGLTAAALIGVSTVAAQTSNEEEFTDEDFAQFFGLLVDGKISRQKLDARCAGKSLGFTFAAADFVQQGPPQRIEYNKTGVKNSVDGRSLRSKHHNAAFGEWTGAVFKPICPGLFVITIDFVATADTDDPVLVHLYLREPGEQRPGHRLITATKPGGSANGAGHGTIALPLHTGDELSTYAETPDSDSRQVLQTVTFTGYKIAHLSDYTKEFDMEAWSADLKVLD